MNEMSSGAPGSFGVRVREAVSDAIRYWELRRIVYNVVLALIVLAYVAVNWPHSRAAASFDRILLVFVLAVLANICYCAAYLGDVFVQISGLRDAWKRWRWVLFVIGTIFAAIITRWFVIGFFTLSPGD
jgi:hypothetical protein